MSKKINKIWFNGIGASFKLRYRIGASFKLGLCLLSCGFLVAPEVINAAAVRFTSPEYSIESVIIGGTGVLRSSSNAIPPVIVSGPRVDNITPTKGDVVWKTSKPSSSIVLYSTTPGEYSNQAGQIINTTIIDHKVSLSQLERGTKYYYRVRSYDVAGNMVESAENEFTTDRGDVTAPVLTKPVSVALSSATSVVITWETDEPSNTVIDYGVKSVDELSVGRFEDLTTFHQYTISGLLSQQSYVFRVRSRDSIGNTYIGQQQNMKTLLAPSITEVQITDITLNSALVSWKTTVPTTSIITYGKDSNYGQTEEDVSGLVTTHAMRLSGLKSGTSYYLRISGEEGGGIVLKSDEYIFKTVVLPLITGLQITEITSAGALLTWTSSSEIDELVRFDIMKSEQKELVGKQDSKGSDVLAAQHVLRLDGLESSTEYRISVTGKDIYGNKTMAPNKNFTTLADSDSPKIENVRTDTTVDLGSRQTVQVLVSYGLSEPGLSYIEYGVGSSGTYTEKIDTDYDYSRNKFMVISGLKPGESYHFHIVAKDRAGNIATSADYLVLAPNQPISLFDLIFSQFRNNFGWLGSIGGN